MVRPLFAAVVGSMALAASLTAGSVLNVSFYPPDQVSCESTHVSGAGSETLTVGACTNGTITRGTGAWVSAAAGPLEVRVDGQPGVGPDPDSEWIGGIGIGATAEYDGSLQAVGGIGPAFLAFDVRGGGANDYTGDFTMAGLGFNVWVCMFQDDRHFVVPIVFGDPVPYTLSVEHELFLQEPDVMTAGVSLANLQVVDANGAPIDGAGVIAPAGSPVPEPGAGLLCAAGGLFLLAGRLRRRPGNG
jgi:hypothetical protein